MEKNTYGTVQSYKTSAHILRYQACDPKLEEDVVKPISTPIINFRRKNMHFHWLWLVAYRFPTNPRPVKTLTLCGFITAQCFPSHTCTNNEPALCYWLPHTLESFIWQADGMLTPERNSLRIPNCVTHTSMLCVHMQPGVVTCHTVKGGSTHTHTEPARCVACKGVLTYL